MDRRQFLGGASVGLTLTACAESRAAAPGLPAPIPPLGLPTAPASSAFWAVWGDGKAEMAGYRATSMRYGAPRSAEIVLITVTEPHHRRTRIKDDAAPEGDRTQVLKLNISEKFQTGIYPYSVMTSVFCPVDRYPGERFSPSKIALGAQEWCGHVYFGLWPVPGGARARGFSYFASEGDVDASLPLPDDALYEDALLIQLRELDGPFAGGQEAWSGALVPSLWRARKAHVPLAPVQATLRRTRQDGRVRFALQAGEHACTYDIEDGGARRVLGWKASDGSEAELLQSARLPYWQLNKPGDETNRAALGL